MAGNGIQPEQEKESHVLPSAGSPNPDAANAEPNPPSTPLPTIPALALDKTPPATSCNLLSWFRRPLATFKASLKRRRCASASGDNSTSGRKKKAQILGDACAEDDEAAEAKARQEKKKAPGSDPELVTEPIPKVIGATTTAHIVDCLNDDDDDVYVKKEDMAIAGKEEKTKGKEQQGSPENVVEKKWVGDPEPIDITGGDNHKVATTSPNKMPESAPITNEEAAAGIQHAAENAEEAAPATEHTDVTAVSGIREIK